MKQIHLYSIIIAFLILNLNAHAEDTLYTQEKLFEDTRELIRIIETVHPDPYINGGGKIAFHRRFYNTLKAIPKEGMLLNDYYNLLLPFVANIRDAHTRLYPVNVDYRSVLPLEFKIIDNKLVVSGIYSKVNENLLNTTLYSVEGILYPELIQKIKETSGYENEVGYICQLKRSLNWRYLFKSMIPEWSESRPISAEFTTQDGQHFYEQFTVSDGLEKPIYQESKYQIPSTENVNIAYNFVDDKRQTAILCVKNLTGSREDFEQWKNLSTDPEVIREALTEVYKKQNTGEPPDDLDLMLSKIQSATELYRQLFIDMKKSKTSNLIVDLRGNYGGGDITIWIFCYYLSNLTDMFSMSPDIFVRKYSSLMLNVFAWPIDEMNKSREIKLQIGDYDFEPENSASQDNYGEKALKENERYLRMTPTFWKEYTTKKHQSYYSPPNIFVLVDSDVFSSAFWFAATLNKMGAKLVGTPPGQGGNCFIESPSFELTNTKLKIRVSDQYAMLYPNDQEKGELLMPDYLLTFEKYKSYDFDPNSELMMALEIINNNLK